MSDSGVLVVDKTAGVTSFDVVALVRAPARRRRVGHAGTLDPDATGVLPILLGEATKLMPYLVDQDKEYVATLRLGVTTDTQRPERPRARRTSAVGSVDRAQIEAACRGVRRPHQAGAADVLGRPPRGPAPLRAGARRAIEVAREPREVVIHALDVEDGRRAARAAPRSCAARAPTCAPWPPISAPRSAAARAVERLVRTRVGPVRRCDDGASVGACCRRRPRAALWARVQPAGRGAGRLAGHPPRRAGAPSASRTVSPSTSRRPRRPTGRWCACTTADGRAARGRGGRARRAADVGRCGSFMRIVRGLESFPPDARPSVVALGVFDGVHLGHRAILGTAVTRARQAGLRGARVHVRAASDRRSCSPAARPAASRRSTSAWR